MRICLMVEGQEGVGWDEWLALARACEEHGLEGLFRSDHYASLTDEPNRGSLDAWATLSALAAVTERIRLGSMVSPATFRHPSVLAKTAATADHVSGGRVELGLGAGWNEREHAAYGFPFPELSVRLELFAEQLEIVHRQWTEDVVDFHGRHYRLEACRALPRPLQDPHPPLIVGGRAGPGTVEPAVRFADEYNSIWARPDELRARRRRLDEACERAGRDPASLRFSLMTPVALGRDEDDLAARLARIAVRAGAADGSAWHAEHRDTGVIGTLDRARERLADLEEAGVERIFLQHLDHADVDGVALIGELAR